LQYEYANPAALHNTGYTLEEFVGLSVVALNRHYNELKIREMLMPLLNGEKESIQIQLDYYRKDGSCYTLDKLFQLTQDGLSVVAIGRDITEKLSTETELRKLLEEKDFLIKEIHHRVKNNLQVMSSVLFLKAQTLKDPVMRALLTDSRQRLRSIALIHERLMQSGGTVTKIGMRDYLTSLLEEIKVSNAVDEAYIEIRPALHDVKMNLEEVVNCGFIVNEIVTNSIKHAFPDNRKGKIAINFTVNESSFELVISDNGVGLPAHVALTNNNLFGIQLVKVFVGNLNGHVTLSGSEGTTWVIQF
jgi:PAS domain S-box-containing protein